MRVWRQLLSSLRGSASTAEVEALAQAGRWAPLARWQEAVYQTYPRLAAPVLCRPTGPLAALNGRTPGKATLRGLVVATDDAHREGSLLQLEVLALPEPIVLVARVEALKPLLPGAPARYDVLLEVCDVAPEALAVLQGVLDRTHPAGLPC